MSTSRQRGVPVENGWRGAGPNRTQTAEAVDLVSDSDTDDSEDMSGSEADEPSWISWFCSLRGNEFFCEVEEDYIEDDFNLSGLSSQVQYYEYALDMILDNEPPSDVMLTDAQHEMLENAAEVLYGLIHARYIVTARGLATMLEKYKNCDFGRCPRVQCEGQPVLPVGTSDLPGQSTVKIFCPKCEDIYYPRTDYHCTIDGAYYGTTFPHLLLMTYPMYRPPKATGGYVPRVFGFKLHASVTANREPPSAAAAAAPRGNGGVRGGGGAQRQAHHPAATFVGRVLSEAVAQEDSDVEEGGDRAMAAAGAAEGNNACAPTSAGGSGQQRAWAG